MINEEERLSKLEARVDGISQELEEIKGKNKPQPEGSTKTGNSRSRNEVLLGILLIVIGGIWLGNSLDWFCLPIPFWPAILILLGLGAIVNSRR